jgi:hypothetical protein
LDVGGLQTVSLCHRLFPYASCSGAPPERQLPHLQAPSTLPWPTLRSALHCANQNGGGGEGRPRSLVWTAPGGASEKGTSFPWSP